MKKILSEKDLKKKAKDKYRYRLIPTGGSSAKYGNCEVCKKPVSEVFHQIEEKQYSNGWTHAGTKDYFGHKECLESKQR